MVISTHVYIEHPDLALSHTIRTLQEITISVFSDAGTDPDRNVYVFWIEASDFETVEETLTEDPTVTDFSVLTETNRRRTYRIEYSDEAKLIAPMITEIGGLTLDSRSHANGWILRLQLRDHDALEALNEYAIEEGIQLELLDLHQGAETDQQLNFGLTDPQAEALVAAFVHGYYDEPREVDLADLATILGISQTAVSGRLRRGSASLIENVLIDESND